MTVVAQSHGQYHRQTAAGGISGQGNGAGAYPLVDQGQIYGFGIVRRGWKRMLRPQPVIRDQYVAAREFGQMAGNAPVGIGRAHNIASAVKIQYGAARTVFRGGAQHRYIAQVFPRETDVFRRVGCSMSFPGVSALHR